MPTLDIFSNDAFSLTSLTKSINDAPYIPGRIGELGLFSEEGISTVALNIEREGTTLSLVPNAPRGASGQVKSGDKRTMIPINTTHLPQRTTIGADEIQGVRAFGTESDVETVQNVVNKRLAKHRRDLDATIEYQRIGALKGQVLDSDGTTVLLDLFNVMGVSQQTKSLGLATQTTKVNIKCVEAKRLVEAALGNLKYKSLRMLCSSALFDAFVGHDKVAASFDRWMNGEFLRSDMREGFYYAGIYLEEYRGGVNGTDFIPAGEGILIPEGVPDLFITNFAPADYMETVNTLGLPYYSKQELLKFNKGVELESQSNPISINTRPATAIKITI